MEETPHRPVFATYELVLDCWVHLSLKLGERTKFHCTLCKTVLLPAVLVSVSSEILHLVSESHILALPYVYAFALLSNFVFLYYTYFSSILPKCQWIDILCPPGVLDIESGSKYDLI